MDTAPNSINGLPMICHAILDGSQKTTGNCKHTVNDAAISVSALAICQVQDSFYLFCCNERWQAITDTWHQHLEDAKHQAEFEYSGRSKTWRV